MIKALVSSDSSVSNRQRRRSAIKPEPPVHTSDDEGCDTFNRTQSNESFDNYMNKHQNGSIGGNTDNQLRLRLTSRRSSQPPECTGDDCKGEDMNRSDSAESFNAYKKKHQSSETFHSYKRRQQPQDGRNCSFNTESLRRRPAADRSSNLRRLISKGESRESFELKQSALYSMQIDGTLEQISNLDHLLAEEEWASQQNFWRRLAMRASSPDTSQKELIQRSTFIIISTMTVGCGVLWGLMYVALGEWLAALMPFIYSSSMGLVLTTCICYAKNKYDVFVNCQLVLILLLPMAVHLALGSMESSGGVMLWSFLCPMGAAFFRNVEESLKWFYLYMTLSAGLLFFDHWKSEAGESNVITSLYFAMNILGVKGVIYAVVFFFARELENEYKKSEEVLTNLLPPPIVRRIKRGEFPIVDHVAGVSILFADLVGFTKASTELHPNFLIGLFLRDIFLSFDNLVYNHGLEKIKTIGDAYMVVGGLNYGTGSSEDEQNYEQHHSHRTMLLATDMFRELKTINKKYNLSFDLRIGVHCGPVVAGVLGLKRFNYDVWGDSVNTASRMESNGVPSQIHLSSDMYELVQNMRMHFDFECCGKKQIKGKGEMTTYVAKPKTEDLFLDALTKQQQQLLDKVAV